MEKQGVPFISTSMKYSVTKDAFFRIYTSRKMQFFYLFMIILCVIDLISTCIFFTIEEYPVWTFCLDLFLNFLLLVDCFIRIYMNGISSLSSLKKVWLEILMIVICIPELTLIIISMFFLTRLGLILEIITVSLIGLILLTRPFAYYSFRKIGIVPSVHLPQSVVASPTYIPEARPDLLRMDTHSSVGLGFNN
jgi:hypothetical protein